MASSPPPPPVPPPQPETPPPLPHPSSHAHPRHVWSEARLIRGITVVNFLPAFPLLVAHATLSESPLPAFGLAPLFVSSVAGLFLISRYRARDRARQKSVARSEYVDDTIDESEGWEGEAEGETVFTHRIMVFLIDAGLTVGFGIVLACTWLARGMNSDATLAMLAAYGTVPLLVNFLFHFYLSVRELVAGLALHGLIQYSAWHVLPPDCPQCGSRLRPEAHPPIPWYESLSRPNLSVPRVSAPSLPSLPRPSLPSFKMPAWMKGRKVEDASLFVDDDQLQRDQYLDDPEEPSSNTSVIATGAGGSGSAVVEEVIIVKKDKKKRSTSGTSIGTATSGTPIYGEDDSSWA